MEYGTPVKVNPPRPAPKPAPKTVVAAVAYPSSDDLNSELKKLLDRMERTRAASPPQIKNIEEIFKKKIRDATTQKQREAVLEAMNQVP